MRKHRGEARKQRRKGRIGPQAQQPLFEGLEPRLLLDGAPQGVTIPDVVPGNVFFEMTDHDNGTSYTANVAGTYTRTTPGGDWTGPDGGVLTATAAPGQWTANEDTWGVFAIKYLKKGAPIVANGNTIGMDDDSSGLADVYYQWLSYVSDTGLVGMFYRGWDREVTIKADGSFAVLTEGVQFDLWAVDASLLKRWTTDGSPPSTDHEGPGYETGRRDTESTYEDWVDSGDGAKVHLLRATSEYFRFSGRLVAPGGYFEGGTVAYWDIDAKGAPAWNATWGGNEIFTDPDGQKADLWTDVELVQDDKGWLAKSNDDGGAYVAPEVQPAAIGDFVWEDTDADGIQDGGEAGIENVTVNLYDSGDNLVASQLTAADGSYLFDNLTPGDYYLEFIPLVGYAFTVQDAGGDDALDSDANPATGQTAVTTLDSGETDLTWDAGLIAPQPGIDIEKATNGEDADNPTGPVLPVGSTATLTYVVANTGNVPLAGVVATDDNGTPGDTSDDFNPTFTGGDTDGDALLDLTEMWTYTASTTVVAGQYTNVSDVVGNPVEEDGTDIPGLPDQTDTDPSNHFGAVAGIDIEKATNGEDADSPTGPVLAVGSTATFTYVVTNTGNVPLAGVVATDDNGTPGNTADDFNPTFVGGDTDNDGLLDLTETWTYTASATVVAGQYTNISDVVGNPVEEDGTDIPGLPDQTDEDPSNHFGEEPSEPGIGLVKSANINFVSPFDPVTYTYTVANTGSISLANVVIFDDNGTPDFAGDDFSPTFVGGDANNDGLLDPTEMWIYSETVILPLIMCQPVDGVPTQAGTMIVDILPNGDVKATFITSMAVNDNTYGLNTGADWDRVHKFTNLVGSDHARFGFTNGDGNVVFDAKVDYISETGTALYPSGFGTFGVDGKEGVINTGSLSDVVGFSTSLSDNLNQSPAYYGFTVDSPVLPDANWEVRMIYSLTLTGATFGASGLGEVRIISVHNSPDKEFNVEDPDPCDQCVTNTAVVTATANGVELSATDDETVCVGDAQPLGSIGDYVWQDNNADGIQNDGDTGIGGVGVTLAGGGADGVLGTADDTTAVTSTAADGSYLFDNLPANDYKVTFDEPAGLAFTLKDQGADDAVDSDADPINGMTDVIALATGQQIRTVDAGLTATGPVIYVCATGEKPAVLVMTYTGDSVENHSQDPRKVTITGDANDEPTVRIIASNKKKLFDRKAKVWFDGTVNLGENFAIDAANANQDKVGAETYVYIIDGQGDLIETIRFHTSCSQPLALGDDFGSITLAGFVGDGGTQLGVQQAAPAPAGIPAPTPEGDADVWAGDLEANRNKVNIELTNNGERDAVISRMLLNWASGSKNLKKVKLDGITIFKKKTAWSADGLLIETDEWAVNEDLRTIGAGATVTLTLEFEREASDIEDDYGMAIDFGDGLTALV